MDVDEPELTSDGVVLLLKQNTASSLAVLASIAQSGELRDFDDLFALPLFYSLSASVLTAAWRESDRQDGLSVESQHDLFVASEEEQRSRRRREDSGDDDEEDEAGESSRRSDSGWQRLEHAYTYVPHLLKADECQPELASQRGAFDSRFLIALIDRFRPKQRKQQSHSTPAPGGKLTREQVAAIVGAGMLGGSGGSASSAAAPGTAATAARHTQNTAVTTIGLGIRSAEPDAPTPLELAQLRPLLHTLYSLLPALRPQILSHMAAFFDSFVRAPLHPHGVGELLAVYGSIVKGYRAVDKRKHDWLLAHVMPLHQPNAMSNELTPLIQHYHEQLVYVLCEYLKRDKAQHSSSTAATASSSTLLPILHCLLVAWPTGRQPNSAKEVLLLHEMERLLEFSSADTFGQFASSFFPYLVSSLSSSHHRVSERCLQLWQNDHFLALIASQRHQLFPPLLPVLLQEKHWNRSVNKMRALVLDTCRQQDDTLWRRVVHAVFDREGGEAESVQAAEELMEQLRPAEEKQASEADKLMQTQAHVPSTLQAVAYKDFVFGHLLGEGSFSQVRYAKRIVKGVGASGWPEYAVKVMSKSLVKEQRYEANVEREQRIMSAFHHPNVTSLIATCENQHHLYFVLEYAAKGDLHTLLTSMGSFSLPAARFFAAEIARGLQHLHSLGLLWGDCKPENVLVHSSGHVKLTDFGSAREEKEVGDGEVRVEGTEEYLAPELRSGGRLSQASDLWAFAVVVYQMLEGRTPQWGGEQDDHAADKRRRRKKDKQAALTSDQPPALHDNAPPANKTVHFSLADIFTDTFDPTARDLISRILVTDPANRFAITSTSAPSSTSPAHLIIDYAQLFAHPFFAGLDIAQLHTQPAPVLTGGSVAAAPDAKWARRKNSMMWAPMPKVYSFADSQWVMEAIPEVVEPQLPSTHNGGAGAEGGEGRLRYVGFKADASMTKVQEAEDEDDKAEDDDDEMLFDGRRLKGLDDGDEDEDAMKDDDEKCTPIRQSSRASSHASAQQSSVTQLNTAALPPPHQPTAVSSSSSALPPRARISIRSAPSTTASNASSSDAPSARSGSATGTGSAFIPNASPLVGVHVPGISGGLSGRQMGNPVAASLLNRVMGGSGRVGSVGAGKPPLPVHPKQPHD